MIISEQEKNRIKGLHNINEQDIEQTSSVKFIKVKLTDGNTGTITLVELDRLATQVGYKK